MNEAGTGLAKVALIGLMAVGSIFLWIGIPVGLALDRLAAPV